MTFIGNSSGAGCKKTAINYAIIGVVICVVNASSEVLFFYFSKDYIASLYFSESSELFLEIATVYNIGQ